MAKGAGMKMEAPSATGSAAKPGEALTEAEKEAAAKVKAAAEEKAGDAAKTAVEGDKAATGATGAGVKEVPPPAPQGLNIKVGQ